MSEIGRLRSQLRAVNMEYSALIRRKTGEGAYVKMAELRAERHILMSLIAAHTRGAPSERAPRHPLSIPLHTASEQEAFQGEQPTAP